MIARLGLIAFALSMASGCAMDAQRRISSQTEQLIDGGSTPAQPQSVHSDLIRGMLARDQNYAALAHVQAQQGKTGDSDELRLLEAEARRKLGQSKQAWLLYRELLQSPYDAEAYHGLGLIAVGPELDSGIRYLREATRRKPTHAVMRSDLGFALMQAGDYDAAMLELSTAVELDVSGGARARNNLILLMLVQDKEKDAVRLAARAGLDEAALNGLRAKAEQMQARRRRAEPAEESTDASESDASTPPPAS